MSVMTEMTDEERKALDKKRKSLLERIDADAALWRTEALSSYAQVRDELRCVEGGPNADKKQFAVAQADLDSALVSMAPPEKCAGARTGLKQYYSGASIERTWAAIHRAGAALYGLYEINDLTAQGTRLCALLAALPGQNSQSILLNEALTNLKSGNAADKRQARSTLREIYQGAMGASDTLQMEARGLRNTLLVTSGALSLIIFILGFVHLFDSSMFSLCTTVEGAGKPICPAGGSSAHGFDVFAIELAVQAIHDLFHTIAGNLARCRMVIEPQVSEAGAAGQKMAGSQLVSPLVSSSPLSAMKSSPVRPWILRNTRNRPGPCTWMPSWLPAWM